MTPGHLIVGGGVVIRLDSSGRSLGERPAIAANITNRRARAAQRRRSIPSVCPAGRGGGKPSVVDGNVGGHVKERKTPDDHAEANYGHAPPDQHEEPWHPHPVG